MQVLAVNAGSSSLKLAIFDVHGAIARAATVRIDRIGDGHGRLVVRGRDDRVERDESQDVQDHAAAFRLAAEAVPALLAVEAVGHRVVRGGVRHHRPTTIAPELVDELRAAASLDPEHGPQSLALIAHLQQVLPGVPHVACFDTAFHRTMPRVAQIYGLPRRMLSDGVTRLGFHGLSCEHIIDLLTALDPVAAQGRLVIAHLGAGASLTAVRAGQSVDTTMGFSPTSGVVMSTRSGDLDPSVLLYLAERGLGTGAIRTLVNRESGLLGVSELTGDMRELLEREPTVAGAAEAVALFCYTVRKYLGAMTAALGGLDTLVFTGGIGEHAAAVRERICADLGYLGIVLDQTRNTADEAVISSNGSRVTVRVMATDEELTIAKHVRALLTESGAHHVSL